MSQTVQVQILDVTERLTSKGNKIYDVKASDGREYSTFKDDLGANARSLKGHMVDLAFSTTQNGQFTNYRFEGARPFAGPAPEQTSGPVQPPSSKDEQIARMSAAKTAFEYAGSSGLDIAAAKSLTTEFAHYFLTGEFAQVTAAKDDIPW